MKSYSEPWVSAPSNSVSSVSKKVRVWELGPYASTLISTLNFRFSERFPVFRVSMNLILTVFVYQQPFKRSTPSV